ncbi:MAG: hypothetical protein DCC67_18525 [Planctomycetota bacterium]|nr:MAG: hypothetical protein DCC67_18525 [Planctomycetota bacterium]
MRRHGHALIAAANDDAPSRRPVPQRRLAGRQSHGGVELRRFSRRGAGHAGALPLQLAEAGRRAGQRGARARARRQAANCSPPPCGTRRCSWALPA